VAKVLSRTRAGVSVTAILTCWMERIHSARKEEVIDCWVILEFVIYDFG
jgi:hypothetical protein